MPGSLIDKLLGRLSHLSQVLLCVFSAWALYYTVIPLYKITILEQTIAQRELELKGKNQELANAMLAIEDANRELYDRRRDSYLQELVTRNLLKCLEPRFFQVIAKNKEYDPHESVANKNYSKCVNESFDRNKAQKKLHGHDYEYLSTAINELKSKLIKMRETAISDMETLEVRARKDKSILEPKSPLMQNLDNMYTALGGEPISEEEEFKSAVSSTILSIATKYEANVSSETLELRSIEWPDN